MKKKGISEALARVEMRLYIVAITKVKDCTYLYKSFKAKVGVHHGSALPPQLFAFVIEYVTSEIK